MEVKYEVPGFMCKKVFINIQNGAVLIFSTHLLTFPLKWHKYLIRVVFKQSWIQLLEEHLIYYMFKQLYDEILDQLCVVYTRDVSQYAGVSHQYTIFKVHFTTNYNHNYSVTLLIKQKCMQYFLLNQYKNFFFQKMKRTPTGDFRFISSAREYEYSISTKISPNFGENSIRLGDIF